MALPKQSGWGQCVWLKWLSYTLCVGKKSEQFLIIIFVYACRLRHTTQTSCFTSHQQLVSFLQSFSSSIVLWASPRQTSNLWWRCPSSVKDFSTQLSWPRKLCSSLICADKWSEPWLLLQITLTISVSIDIHGPWTNNYHRKFDIKKCMILEITGSFLSMKLQWTYGQTILPWSTISTTRSLLKPVI